MGIQVVFNFFKFFKKSRKQPMKYIILFLILGLCVSIGYAQPSVRSQEIGYTPLYQLKTVKNGNGTVTEYGYDKNNNLVWFKSYQEQMPLIVASVMAWSQVILRDTEEKTLLQVFLCNPNAQAVQNAKITVQKADNTTLTFLTVNKVEGNSQNKIMVELPKNSLANGKNVLKVSTEYVHQGQTYTSVNESVEVLVIDFSQCYQDVKPSHRFYRYIMQQTYWGVMRGREAYIRFAPNAAINREETSVSVFRQLSRLNPQAYALDLSGTDYADKDQFYFAYNETKTLHNKGVFSNIPNFMPRDSTSKEQMMAILVKAFYPNADFSNLGAVAFSDVSPTSEYYKYIAFAKKIGLIKGFHDGTFKPKAKVSRGFFAKLLWRASTSTSVSSQNDWDENPSQIGTLPTKLEISPKTCQKVVEAGSRIIFTTEEWQNLRGAKLEGEQAELSIVALAGTINRIDDNTIEWIAPEFTGLYILDFEMAMGVESVKKTVFVNVVGKTNTQEDLESQNQGVPIIYVKDFMNLQDAINAAKNLGADRVRILVPKGTYTGDLVLYDGLFLMTEEGCDANDYILKGKITYSGSKVAGVVGFTIDTDQKTAFDLQSGRFFIHKSIIKNNAVGVQIAQNAEVMLRNNDFLNNGIAIKTEGKTTLFADIFANNTSDLEKTATAQLRIAHNLLSATSNITGGSENVIGDPSVSNTQNQGTRDGYLDNNDSRNTIGYLGSKCNTWERDWLYGNGTGGSWNVATIYARDFLSFQKAVNYARAYADSIGSDYVILSVHAGTFYPDADSTHVYVPDGVRIIAGYYEPNKFCEQKAVLDANGKDFCFKFAKGTKGSQLVNFELRNASKSAIFSENSNLLIYNNFIHNSQNGIISEGNGEILVANNEFKNISGTAIETSSTNKGKVFNNQISACGADYLGNANILAEYNNSVNNRIHRLITSTNLSTTESNLLGHFRYQNRNRDRSNIGLNGGVCPYLLGRSGTKPDAPVNLRISLNNGIAILNWLYKGELSEIKAFNIYNTNGALLGTVNSQTSSFELGNFVEGVQYEIWATTIDLFGNESNKSVSTDKIHIEKDMELRDASLKNVDFDKEERVYEVKRGQNLTLNATLLSDYECNNTIDTLMWKNPGRQNRIFIRTTNRELKRETIDISEENIIVPNDFVVGEEYTLNLKITPQKLSDKNDQNNEAFIIIKIVEEDPSLEITVFSNPNLGSFKITSSGSLMKKIVVTDILGRVVQEVFPNQLFFDMNIVDTKGIFTLLIQTEHGVITKKVIIL